jgi:hypothetical protein
MAPNARTKFALGLLSGSGLLEVFLISLYEVVMRFRREVPQAVYVHCHAHWLNLVLVDCVSNVEPAGEFFLVVQMLLHFFSDSVAHSIFPKKQVELEPTEKTVELERKTATRWVANILLLVVYCVPLKKSLPGILSTVTDVIKLPGAKRRTEAKSIKAQLVEEFALQLIFVEESFHTMKFLSDLLRAFASALSLIESVISSLEEKQNDNSWGEMWDKAQALCTKSGIAVHSEDRVE